MTTQTADALVERYLARLEAASWPLPPDRRAELIDGIREHINEARTAGAVDEAAVRELLDRLGTPEEIARAEAQEGGGAVPPYPVVVQHPSLAHETWTVCLLTFGNLLLPVISWFAGAVLLVAGGRWTRREKALGLLVVPGGPIGSFVLFRSLTGVSWTGTCSQISADSYATVCTNGPRGLAMVIVILAFAVASVAPIAVAWVLYRRAKRRAATESPYLVQA